MRAIIRLSLSCAITGYLLSSTQAAEDPDAATRATLQRLQATRKARPGDGVLVFYEALVRLRLGEREPAFDLLRSLRGRKLGLIPAKDTGFDGVWNDPKFEAIRKGLVNEEQQTPISPVAFRLQDPKLIPEGIAYDSKGNRFFLGSVAQHKIIVTDSKGKAQDFSSPSDKLDAVLGLTVDPIHNELYAVSTNGFEESAKKERRNAVVRYDLSSGKMVERFAAAEAKQLNDLTVAPDGTLYATDSEGGTLFRKKSDEKELARLGEAGGLRGANGIALSPEGKLYVTLATGIARVDPRSGEAVRMSQPDNVVTGGIDGLYWHDNDLFGIQNTTNPGRVIRVTLTDKGERIAGITLLQSSQHPDFDEPTTGAIANNSLNVIGNSYVSRLQPDGTIRDATTLKGTAVIAVPLRR